MGRHEILKKQSLFVSSTFTAAASNLVTLASGKALPDGFGPFRVSTSAADLPDGTLVNTNYWWISAARTGPSDRWSNTGYFAASAKDAEDGVQVDILDAGSGTHTLVPGVTSGGSVGIWYFPLPIPGDVASLHLGWHDGTTDCKAEIEATSLARRDARLYEIDAEKWALLGAIALETPSAGSAAAGSSDNPLVGLGRPGKRHRLKITVAAASVLTAFVS